METFNHPRGVQSIEFMCCKRDIFALLNNLQTRLHLNATLSDSNLFLFYFSEL